MLAGLPLVFEPNLGQTDAQVRFLTRAEGMTAFLTDHESVMVLSRHRETPEVSDSHKTPEIEQTVVRMKLEGARAVHSFEGLEKAGSISNYFIGNDPSKWRSNIPNYRKVRATGIYPGIDLIYYGDGRRLEYDFVVRPGANPRIIRLAYEGADSLTTDPEGNLLIASGGGTLLQRKPLVYQEINGERREVRASYSVRAGKVEFAVANWDRKRDLVIDPVLEYSTYLGGTGTDQARSIAVDLSGAAYVTGNTSGANFPTIPVASSGQHPSQGSTYGGGVYDAFVTKLNPSGTALVYSTYLGGDGNDQGNGIAVNGSGEAYVTGYTNSCTPAPTCSTTIPFPTTPDASQKTYGGGAYDAFVTKLSADGSQLLYSTYSGGSGNDQAKGIAVDSSGAAYVIGDTDSINFPIKSPGNAFQSIFGGTRDAFVAKLAAHSADLVYSTYPGGNGQESGFAIAVDAIGEAYAMGITASQNFRTTPNAFQTALVGSQNDFVTKLDASGHTPIYSTFVGGGGEVTSGAIAVDIAGAAYVTGTTYGNSPVTLGAFQQTFGGGGTDAYVFKLNPSGNALDYFTFLGGSGADLGFGIAVDSSGASYVTGYTYSADFPTTSGAFQPSLEGIYNAFVTKLNANGTELESSTYLGGSGRDQGTGIALAPAPNSRQPAQSRTTPTLRAIRNRHQAAPTTFLFSLTRELFRRHPEVAMTPS
jgi:hypothetical protein